MKRLILLALIIFIETSKVNAQSWTGILAPSRAIDWSNAGLPAAFPDGETTSNPWTPPTRSQCGPTLVPSGGDDATQITNAFNGVGGFSACTPPYVVLLGSGNFQIQSFLRLGGDNSRNNVTMRGSGPMTTTMTITNSGAALNVGACCTGGGAAALTSAASNYTRGQTSILLQNATAAPFVGAVAYFIQCDNGFTNSSSGQPLGTCTGAASDPLQLFHCSDAICAGSGNQDATRQQDRQVVLITSATNTGGSNWTVTVSPGLYLADWTFSQGATLKWDNRLASMAIGIGIENMTIKVFDAGHSVDIGSGIASWMKGVREIGFNNTRIFNLNGCKNCLVANNYWFGNDPLNPQNGLGLIAGDSNGADNLFINNIAAEALYMDDGNSHQGIVIAYTYARESSSGGDGYQSTLFEHAPGSNLMLRESNQWGRTNDDDTHGTHNLETDFRNNLNCADVPYDLGIVGGGFLYGSFARFANSVGNAIGLYQPSYSVAKCAPYQNQSTDGSVWNLDGTGTALSDTSGLTVGSLMRWGNVSGTVQSSDTPANSGIRFVNSEVPTNLSTWPNSVPYQNTVPSTTNLPCSFFLKGFSATTCTPKYTGGTGLSWWKVCKTWTTFPTACASSTIPPFPVNGPDVLAASGAPLNYANDIPSALAWKNLPIDTTLQNSYTVTASSWSSGTETLTVTTPTSFPAGGFQFSGAPVACIPSSGVSFTGRPDNEILITSSTGSQIKYALPLNPGVSCNSTLKWPDVRQFDERVYQVDSAIVGTPTLVQHAACPNGRNPGGATSSTPDYICPLPEPSQSGNALIVGVTTSSGATLTVSSTKFDGTADGNAWNRIDTVTDGNNAVVQTWLALNVAAGTRFIKLHRSAITSNTAMSVSEFYNVATSSAVDGTAHSCTAGASSTSISSGSITPLTSGDLIWQWAMNSSGGGGVPSSVSSFTVGSQPNITWNLLGTDLNDGDAVQAGVQTVAGAINPTFTTGTAHPFNSCSMALKAATAGTAPTNPFRIVHVLHQNFPVGAPNPLQVQFPTSGNLFVNSYIGGGSNITTITDTAGNSWSATGTAVGNEAITAISQMYYAPNATSANNLTVHVNRNDTLRDGTFMMYDFVGAATSPFDKDSGGQTNNQTSIVNPLVTCAPGAPTNCTFAPTGNTGGNEVVLANAGWNFCTGTNMSLPTPASGGLFDPATDTGVSIDGPEPADQNNGWMHYYTAATSGITVSWVMNCGSNPESEWAGRVAAFKSATSGGPVVPTVTTTTATNITLTDASSGGAVTSNGGATVTSEGVCYGLAVNPTTPCISPDSGGTATPFTSTIIQLLPNKLYHYRAFATNSAGTGFGPDQTFTTTGGPLAINVGGVQGLEPRPNQIGPNLLLNGNFTNPITPAWTLTACGLFDSTTTHTADGSGSLKILNCGATENTSQVVGWTQYTGKYQFSFWTQTDSAAGGELNIAASILNVGSLSGSGGCQTAENSYTVIPAAGASGAVPRLPTLPGQGWVQNFFQCYYNPFQFQEAAAAGAAMKTRLSITSTGQIGTVWVDDISFNEIWYPLHSFLTYPNFHGYLWNDKVPRIPQQPGSPWPYAAPVTGEIMGVGEIIPSNGNTLASGTLTVKMSTVAGCASGVLSTKTFNSASTPALSATTYWHFLPGDYGTLTIGNGYYICSSYTDPGGTFPVPDWLIYYENSTFRNTLENWIDVDQEFVHNGVRSWWIGASDRTTATYTTNLVQMNVQSTCAGGPPSSNTSGAACIEQQWQGPCSGTVNMGNPVTTCTGNTVSPLATGSSLPANFTGGPTRSADIAALHYTEMFAPIGLYSNCNPGWSAVSGYYTIASDTCTPYLQVGQDFGFVSNFISQLYYGSVVTETDTDTGPPFNPTVTVGAGSISGNFLAVQLSVAEASLPDTQSNGTFDQYPETPPSTPVFANLAGGPKGVTVQTPACPYPSTRYFGYYIYAGVTPTAALPAASTGTLNANGTNVVTWASGATFPASGINYITITIAGVPKNFTIQSFDSSTQLHLWTTVTTGSGLAFTFQGATQRQPIQAATFATSQPVGNAPIPCGTTVNIASLVNTSINPVTVDMGNKRELNVFWMPSTMTDAQSLGFRAQTLQSTTLASGMGMNYIHDEALPTSAGNVFYQLQRGMRAYGNLNFGYLADDKSDFWQWRALDDVVSNDPFPTMGGSTFFEENAIYAPIGWPTHPGFSCQTYQSSTVSVNGTSTITWVSGGQFNPAWTGTVLINNIVYTIVPPVTATSMTLTANVPSGPNTTFTFPNNIGPVLCFPAGVDAWAHELGRYDYGSRPSSVFVTEEPFGTLAGVSYQEVRRIELKGITGIQEWGVTGVNMSRWVFGNAGFEQMVWNGNYQSFADHLAWGNFLSSIAPILIQPVTDSSILGFHNMVTNETASTTAAADCGATSGYTISSHFPFGQIRTVVHKDSASPQVVILANNLCYGTPSVTFTGNFGGATTVTAQGDATAPGASYTIPISGGSFTDSFTPMEQKVYILSVAVTPPIASVTPSSLTYASQLVGTTSISQPVTVQNIGGSNLVFNTLFATVTGNFAVASGTTCVSNGTLAPGASCTINVTFSPLSAGTLSGVLTISDNSGGSSSTQTVPLQGTGLLQAIRPLTGTGSVTGNGSVVVHP